MTATKKYGHLQPEERVLIAAHRLEGLTIAESARRLSRDRATIGRELARNTIPGLGYRSATAQRLTEQRRIGSRPLPKLDPTGALWPQVLEGLRAKWSPEQIAIKLKQAHRHEPELRVSHETIYTTIYARPKGELRKELIDCLRWSRSTRKRRSAGEDRRGRLVDAISIHMRPPEAEDRLLPGHWEGDLIRGAGNRSAIGVLVDRTTRLILLAKMPDATAASALAAFTTKLRSIAEPVMRKTLTYDQGKEMALHKQLTENTGVNVYFCDPHSPWQRGTCENTNGLLRQYFPKGTDLSVHSQEHLDAVADQMNHRPRATLNYESPIDVYSEFLKLLQQSPEAFH
jgi:IS30 family transposase